MYLLQASFATWGILLWTAQAARQQAISRNVRANKGKGSKKCPKGKSGKSGKSSVTGVEGKLYEGAKIPFGDDDGLMWSFVEWDQDGNPARVGLKFTVGDPMVDSLPTALSDGTWNIRAADGTALAGPMYEIGGHEYIPNLPYFQGPAADALKFQHIVANYNPIGTHGSHFSRNLRACIGNSNLTCFFSLYYCF